MKTKLTNRTPNTPKAVLPTHAMEFSSVNISSQSKAKWDIMFPLMLKTFPLMKDSDAKLITKEEAIELGCCYVSKFEPEDHLHLVCNKDYKHYTKTWDEVRKYLTDVWDGVRIGMELPRTKKNKEMLNINK